MSAHSVLRFYHSFVANVADLATPRSTVERHSLPAQSVQAITSQLLALYNIATVAVRTVQKTHHLTSLLIGAALLSKLPVLPKQNAVKPELKPRSQIEIVDNRNVKSDINHAQMPLHLVNPVFLTPPRPDATHQSQTSHQS
jgi:hypothetical protein